MTNQVVTIDMNQTVKNAARTMNQFGISSLLVYSKEGLRGIVTERDIITRVVCTGSNPSEVYVNEIMSEPVIAVGPDEPLESAIELMLTQRIKKLPVMIQEEEAVKIVGILSLIDVAEVQPNLLNSLREMVQGQAESLEAGFYVS
ncbi:MAG: CBS domain-containing protein [Candidatus Bathyarchaeota archaeon]|nr:CBS domain-containing protein [Candidatus Bathyarchaeota archaeon]